jgi:hypothetical protein
VNVLIICEDFRKDQFIAKPIIAALFAERMVPQVKIAVCLDPILGGIDQATRWEKVEEIIRFYPMVDLFLLLVDRDGVTSRRAALDKIEQRATSLLRGKRRLLAENAWQELEAWALAGLDLPWSWKEVRAERDLKERYFERYVASRGLAGSVGGGRKILGREAASKIRRVLSRCRELQSLAENLVLPNKSGR